MSTDKIPGGLAKGMSLSDIAKHHKLPLKSLQSKLEQGIKTEMEHTTDKAIAREIAMDHIYEDPNYYSKLKQIETEGTCGYTMDAETGEELETPGGLEEGDKRGLDMYALELQKGLEEKLIKDILHTPESYKQLIPEITKFMLDKGMNLRPLPKVKFIEDDKKNAQDILGRTAFYNPEEKSVTLYTLGRHPKDILRSFCHEMIHHLQNVEGRLPKFYTTNTQEDSALNDIEEEAHRLGSMTMREFEDTIKK